MIFPGPELQPADHIRLSSQLFRVRELMLDGEWRTLGEISQMTASPAASVSAQLRHLRKARFGGHLVERRHLGNGLWEYRVQRREQ